MLRRRTTPIAASSPSSSKSLKTSRSSTRITIEVVFPRARGNSPWEGIQCAPLMELRAVPTSLLAPWKQSLEGIQCGPDEVEGLPQ